MLAKNALEDAHVQIAELRKLLMELNGLTDSEIDDCLKIRSTYDTILANSINTANDIARTHDEGFADLIFTTTMTKAREIRAKMTTILANARDRRNKTMDR